MTPETITKDFAAALTRARAQGQRAMQELAEDHLPLVAAMVRRFPWPVREREELYQQGCIGLMKALSRFDPSMGVRFSTYAVPLILGEMRMLCRMDAPLHIPRHDRELRGRIRRGQALLTSHLGREPTLQELSALLRIDPAELVFAMEEITVVSSDAPRKDGTPSRAALLTDRDPWMDRLMLRDLISRLPRQDRRLIVMRFHLGMTQAETARSLGTTQVQVSRRELALKQQLREEWYTP